MERIDDAITTWQKKKGKNITIILSSPQPITVKTEAKRFQMDLTISKKKWTIENKMKATESGKINFLIAVQSVVKNSRRTY